MSVLFSALLQVIEIIISLTTRQKVDLVKKGPVEKMPVPDKKPVEDLPETPLSQFKLGAKSRKELVGVHPNLIKIVKLAIQYTNTDFRVFDGKRSAKEQNRHYRNGASKLDGYKSKSYHQSGNAVDLVPIINGQENHADWDNYYHAAQAMVRATKELGFQKHVRWGAVWDRRVAGLPDTAAKLKREVQAYARRHPGPDFLDGPHWEWRA